MTTALDPQTAKRLAFIRLVYDQGVQQSRLPAPLNATALLSLHDAVELFLVLVGDHIGAQLDRRTNFLDYWDRLKKASNGVHLSHIAGMRRLNDHRNGLKHAGNMPLPEVIEQSRVDVRAFFDDNVPRVFTPVSFDSIDLTDVIPQNDVRTTAKEAVQHAAHGDRALAMVKLSRAFWMLMREGRVTQNFGRTVTRDYSFKSRLQDAFSVMGGRRFNSAAGRLADATDAVADIQEAMRVMSVGLDFPQYARFRQLLPNIWHNDEDKDAESARHDEERGRVADQEEFEFCRQFLVTVSLRVAEAASHQQQPSWRRT